MNRKELIAQVRRGKSGVRIDDVEIVFNHAKVIGTGILECDGHKFFVKIRLPDGVTPPPMPTVGFLSRKDCGILTGVIDHDLPFKVTELFPSCSQTNNNGRITLTYGVSSIELIPQRWDNLTTEAKGWIQEQLHSVQIVGEFITEISKLPGPECPSCSVSISGLLLDFDLIAKNAGTETVEKNEFLGERRCTKLDTAHGILSPEWGFALIEKNDDAEFHLHSREGFESKCEADDLKALSAFQTALAFIHGQHAWPFTLEYQRDGRLVIDRIHPPRKTMRTTYTAFSERIWFNALTGNFEWSFAETLGKAFCFFLEKSELSEEVSQLLFLVREAVGPTKGIVFCSLLESLIKAIYEAKIAVAAPATEIREKKAASNITEKFHQVVEYLELPWENDWEIFCEFWREHRNRLVHRATKGNDDDSVEGFLVESRVAGAINMLILKVMGYKGMVNSSVCEDQFKRI